MRTRSLARAATHAQTASLAFVGLRCAALRWNGLGGAVRRRLCNFSHIGFAFLTLLRCSMGEDWNLVMEVSAHRACTARATGRRRRARRAVLSVRIETGGCCRISFGRRATPPRACGRRASLAPRNSLHAARLCAKSDYTRI
jgi:hypothetical protein